VAARKLPGNKPDLKPSLLQSETLPELPQRYLGRKAMQKQLYLDIDRNSNVIRLTRQGFVAALRNNQPSVEIRWFLFYGAGFNFLQRSWVKGRILSLAKK
jgi:hypothetical protein